MTAACTSNELTIFVAVFGDQPIGFVSVALNAYHERMA